MEIEINRPVVDADAAIYGRLAAFALVCLSFLFLYAGVFAALAEQWRSQPMYSHGPLVPLVSGYLLWTRRDRLFDTHGNPRRLIGLSVLLLGVSMQVMGHAAAVLTVQQVSILVTLTGMAGFLFGLPSLRVLWLPIGYLMFMIPVWEEGITRYFHPALQSFSAHNAVLLLSALGIPAYREGVCIHLPNQVLEVAQSCSGVNHLTAVVAMGIPMAYLFLKTWPRRIILIGGALVVALLSNGVRVALIGVFSHNEIGAPLHGPFHILQGLFVSFVGYAALFALTWLLHTGPTADVGAEQTRESVPMALKLANSSPLKVMGFCGLLLATAGGYVNLQGSSPAPLRSQFELFPTELAGWNGIQDGGEIAASGLFRASGVDSELSRVFQNNRGRLIWLYAGYFEFQDSRKKVINYRTQELHRGALPVHLDLDFEKSVEVNRRIGEEGGKKRLTFFYYDINGRVAADRMTAKVYSLWDTLTRNRSNAAVVIFESELTLDDEVEALEEDLKAFMRDAYPHLRQCLPSNSHTISSPVRATAS